jgi:hypothetical protein
MDEVQKPGDSECYTPSLEHLIFNNYVAFVHFKVKVFKGRSDQFISFNHEFRNGYKRLRIGKVSKVSMWVSLERQRMNIYLGQDSFSYTSGRSVNLLMSWSTQLFLVSSLIDINGQHFVLF